MTQRSEIDRVLEVWMADGPTAMPDRVVDVVADRISVQRQRRSWRLLRRLPMHPLLKLTAAVAAVLVVAVVAWQVLPRVGGVGGQPTAVPSPTPGPTLTPSPTVSSEPSPIAYHGQVQGETLRFTYTAPAGWTTSGWAFTNSQGFTGPTGIGVGASGAVNVPDDPCDGVGKVSNATTAEAVLADLQARDDLVVSNPVAATLGGLSGIRVDVALPADLSACADLYIVFAEPDGSGVSAQGPSNLLDLWILDAEGGPIWLAIEHFAGTPSEDYAEAQAIVSSIVFTP
jgi:hypothetical protein